MRVSVRDRLPTPASVDGLEVYQSVGDCQFPYTGVATVTCQANGTWTLTGTCRYMYVCDDPNLCICRKEVLSLACQGRPTAVLPPRSSLPPWPKIIDFSATGISRIPSRAFDGLSSTTTLDLSFCHITEISPDAFVGLGELRVLFLFGNSGAAFPNDMLLPTPKLLSLSASETNIRNLTRALLQPVPDLTLLYVAGDMRAHAFRNTFFLH